MGWKDFGELILKYVREVLGKSFGFWVLCAITLTSGVLLYLKKWSLSGDIFEKGIKWTFVFGIVVFLLIFIQKFCGWCKKIYSWFNRKKIKEKIDREKETKISNTIKGFNFHELAFLLKFDGESKRITVSGRYIDYINLKNLDVISEINKVGGGFVHAELHVDYKENYEKIKLRFHEEIELKMKEFSNDMLRYLISFKGNYKNKKCFQSDEINEVIKMFEYNDRGVFKLMDVYKNVIFMLEKKWIGEKI